MYSLLSIDDEQDHLEIGTRFLEESGDFYGTTINPAAVALALPGREKMDAIISDFQVPGMEWTTI